MGSKTRILMLMMMITAAVGLVVAGCPSHKPPEPLPDDDGPDPDVFVELIGEGLTESGTLLQADATTWDECIAGVVLQSVGEHTTGVAIPIKQAVEAGTCSGVTQSVTIDPGPCLGLPGVPTVESQDAARDEVMKWLNMTMPVAAGMAEATATTTEDPGLCVAMKLISDFLSPSGVIVDSILTVVEQPGAPFTVPGTSWDCAGCLPS